MSTLTDTFVLPESLAAVVGDAWTSFSYGKRHIGWTLPEPGNLFRNAYVMAWIEVSETEPWSGEVRYLHATRRVSADYARESWTEKGREALSAELLPAINRYGFGRLWEELHRQKGNAADVEETCERQAQLAEDRAAWWRDRAIVETWWREGRLTARGTPRTDYRERERVAFVPAVHSTSERRIIAADLTLDGQLLPVAWMLDNGEVVPAREVSR